MQSVTDIISFLDSGWTIANTDGYKPQIIDALEVPWQSLDFGLSDILYVKNETELIKTGMFAMDFYHDVLCMIEVMTGTVGELKAGRAHFKKLIDETMRLVKANARLAGYAFTAVTAGRPRFVKDRKIYTCNIEVKQLKVKTS